VGGWAGATAYNRGQILYRVAELMEGRRSQFVEEVRDGEGLGKSAAQATVDAAIDRWVWYAGWSDKIAQVYGNANPVAGPYFNLTTPEPTGVVGVIAPADSSLLGLVSVMAPVIVTGNTCVVLASEDRPLPAITLAEVLATSDLPGGVVNILTGRVAETAPWLAGHMDVNGIDLTGITAPALATELEVAAAENLKRVVRPASASGERSESARERGSNGILPASASGERSESARERGSNGTLPASASGERSDWPTLTAADWTLDPGLDRMLAFLEAKTVWHPKGV
jgi:acyl-CoA reductase-like NAD-dependent aldehyde dehydrogenase